MSVTKPVDIMSRQKENFDNKTETDPWDIVFEGIEMFTDDFMEEGRGTLEYEVREPL